MSSSSSEEESSLGTYEHRGALESLRNLKLIPFRTCSDYLRFVMNEWPYAHLGRRKQERLVD